MPMAQGYEISPWNRQPLRLDGTIVVRRGPLQLARPAPYVTGEIVPRAEFPTERDVGIHYDAFKIDTLPPAPPPAKKPAAGPPPRGK